MKAISYILLTLILLGSEVTLANANKVNRTVYVEVWDSLEPGCPPVDSRFNSSQLRAQGSGYLLGEGPQYYLLSAYHVIQAAFRGGYTDRCIFVFTSLGSYVSTVSYPDWQSSNPIPAETIRPFRFGESDVSILPLKIPAPPRGVTFQTQARIKSFPDDINNGVYISHDTKLKFSGFSLDVNYALTNQDIKLDPATFNLYQECILSQERCVGDRVFEGGYSGGPVFDSKGMLVGIVSTRLNNKGTFTPLGRYIGYIKQFGINADFEEQNLASDKDVIYRAYIDFRDGVIPITPNFGELGIKSVALKPMSGGKELVARGIPVSQRVKYHEGTKYNWEFISPKPLKQPIEVRISYIDPSSLIGEFVWDPNFLEQRFLKSNTISEVVISRKLTVSQDYKHRAVSNYNAILNSILDPKLLECIDEAKRSIKDSVQCWVKNQSNEERLKLYSRFKTEVYFVFQNAMRYLDEKSLTLKYEKELYDYSLKLGFVCIAKDTLETIEKRLDIGDLSFSAYRELGFSKQFSSNVHSLCTRLRSHQFFLSPAKKIDVEKIDIFGGIPISKAPDATEIKINRDLKLLPAAPAKAIFDAKTITLPTGGRQ